VAAAAGRPVAARQPRAPPPCAAATAALVLDAAKGLHHVSHLPLRVHPVHDDLLRVDALKDAEETYFTVLAQASGARATGSSTEPAQEIGLTRARLPRAGLCAEPATPTRERQRGREEWSREELPV
jgi:hypothetical protein